MVDIERINEIVKDLGMYFGFDCKVKWGDQSEHTIRFERIKGHFDERDFITFYPHRYLEDASEDIIMDIFNRMIRCIYGYVINPFKPETESWINAHKRR